MNRIFKTLLFIQTFMFAIATSVFADEACDDAIADGKAAYNSGNYATAQKHFENVVKWCGGSYGAASSWIQNCKNKQAEIKRAQEQKKQEQEQKKREQEQKDKERQKNKEPQAIPNTVTDCQGHTYPVVKIGDQYWMGENMQCTQYDTQSERAGATLSTSSNTTYAPYYTDGRNATTEYSGSLTSSQRKRLGLLYNWAAALGLSTENEAKNRTIAFSCKRQGICPNGWHIPTALEWSTLKAILGSNAGQKLKTTSGWYENSSGSDTYGFAALPAGHAKGNKKENIGFDAAFWTSSINEGETLSYIIFHFDNALRYFNGPKEHAQSVRCVKN